MPPLNNQNQWWASRQAAPQNYSQNTQNMMAGPQPGTGLGSSTVSQKPMSVFPGKFIADANEISIQDVPMDSALSLFPANDFSCIIAKAWNSQGTIDTVKYIPEKPIDQSLKEDPIAKMEARLERIEKLLTQKQNQKSYYKKPYQKNHQNGVKKEETAE